MKKSVLAIAALAAASVCLAEFKPICTMQVASKNVMNPQLSMAGAKMKFPMLPMIAAQAIGESDSVRTFGRLDADAEFGMRLFADGKLLEQAVRSGKEKELERAFAKVDIFPVADCAEAWRKAHPQTAMERGALVFNRKTPPETPRAMRRQWKEYAFFSKDGKYAFISERLELAEACAKSGRTFDAPLKKGLVCIEGESALFTMGGSLGKALALGAASAQDLITTGGEGDDDEEEQAFKFLPDQLAEKSASPLLDAFFAQCAKVRLLLGVSSTGFDLRLRLTPRPGSDLAAAPRRTLGAEALKFAGVPNLSTMALVCAPVAPDAGTKLGKAWRNFLDEALGSASKYYLDTAKQSEQDEMVFDTCHCLDYAVRMVRAMEGSSAKCAWLSFFAAEMEGKKDEQQFKFGGGFHGLDGKVPFKDAKPASKGKVEAKLVNDERQLSLVASTKKFVDGKVSMAARFAEALPESGKAQQLVLAGWARAGFAPSEDDTRSGDMVLSYFAWRKESDWRMIMRVPYKDIQQVLGMMVQISE